MKLIKCLTLFVLLGFQTNLFAKDKVLLIFAMEVEARPFLNKISYSPYSRLKKTGKPFEYYISTEYQNFDLIVALNGKDKKFGVDQIGKEPALINAHHVISQEAPTLVISAGTAGAYGTKGAEIGKVYLSKDFFYYHDRRIDVPKYKDYKLGKIKGFNTDFLSESMSLAQGTVTTGSSLDTVPDEVKAIAHYNGELKDMEAAALAELADFYDIPFFAMKAVTDLMDGDRSLREQFVANHKQATENLSSQLTQMFKILDRDFVKQVRKNQPKQDDKLTITKSELEGLFQDQLQSMENLGRTNPSLVILFSGTQAMGKTYLARKIEENLKGLRFSTNVARANMELRNIRINRANVFAYTKYFFENISQVSKNGLIIFDSSIDRVWSELKNLLEKEKQQKFLIRLNVPYELVGERLKERNDFFTVYPHFEEHQEAHKSFGEKYAGDIGISLDKTVNASKSDLDALLDKIKKAFGL